MRKGISILALLVLVAPLAAHAAPPSEATAKSMAAIAQILQPVEQTAFQPDARLDLFLHSLGEVKSIATSEVIWVCRWSCAPCGQCDPGDRCVQICP